MKKQQKIFFAVLAAAMFGLPGISLAMLPVVDAGAITNLIKNYNQLKSQYDLLHQTYQNAEQELNQTKQLTRDSEGHYGLGRFMNGSQEMKNREWSPDNWKRTLEGLSGGNPERYQELVKTYQHDHPSLTQSVYRAGASEDKALVYLQDVQVNRAAQVNATYAFNNIKSHLQSIDTLSKKIDQTQNTKAATDLNSRLLAEVAYIQTQELKMQVLMNEQMAAVQAGGIAEKTASAKFNTLPRE